MERFLFPQLTDEEKSYCAEILAKYKSQPTKPLNPRLIPPDDAKWYPTKYNLAVFFIAREAKREVEEYQAILKRELDVDPTAIAHWMVPYAFRVCWKHKVPCGDLCVENSHEFEKMVHDSSIDVVCFNHRTPELIDPLYFPSCVFNTKFYDTLQTPLSKEHPIWDSIYSDVNKMIRAVATKTVYHTSLKTKHSVTVAVRSLDVDELGELCESLGIDYDYLSSRTELLEYFK